MKICISTTANYKNKNSKANHYKTGFLQMPHFEHLAAIQEEKKIFNCQHLKHSKD